MSLKNVEERKPDKPDRWAAKRLRNGLERARLFAWPLVVLLCGVAVAYQAAMLEHRTEKERQREIVRSQLEPIRGGLSRELFGAIQLTEGIAGLITIEGHISDERLRVFAAELLSHGDLIRNIAVAPDNIVRFVFPMQGNERVIGLEYSESPEQWPSVSRMMSERRVVVAGPVDLVQGGIGVIGRRPIYVSGQEGAPAMRSYWGLISTVIDFDRLLSQTTLADASSRLSIAFRGVDGLGESGAVFWGDAGVFDDAPVTVDVPLPSGSWQLAAIPRNGWPPLRVWTSRYFLAGSLLSTILAAFLLGLLQTSAARRRVAEALTKSEQQLKAAMRVGRVGLWRWNQQTDKVTLSDEIYDLYGLDRESTFTPQDLLSRLVPPEDAKVVGEAFNLAKQGHHRLSMDHRAIRPDGEIAWLSTQAEFAYDARGNPTELLGTFIDITQHKRASEQIQKLHEDLQRHAAQLEQRVAERTVELASAKERAESADRLKSAFLATMSHELRTPLNSIIGFTSIVLQEMAGPLNDEQKKQLGMVRDSARHLLSLINDVLDISKIEAGQLTVAAEPFDLAASIRKVADIVRPLTEKKNLSLTVRVGDGVGATIGDARRVEQILLNLLSNAIKFTERGSVSLVAETVANYLGKEKSTPDSAVRLCVTDTGIGIKPDDLGKLFQPFRQIESSLARAYEGTGLGLAISRRLATLMGGAIEAKSRWQQGSEFVVTLPLQSKSKNSEAA